MLRAFIFRTSSKFQKNASENVGEYILSISKNSHNSTWTDKLEHYISFTMLFGL